MKFSTNKAAATSMTTKSHVTNGKRNNVMPHNQFIDRIRKSLYFGNGTLADDMEVSRPLAEYASELFTKTHKGHSLNRLNSAAAGSVHATPCSLIMALIYLDRINLTDPNYVRRITPQELFIVSMMISTKFYAGYDEEVNLSDWADDGNMTENRLKQLELDFLSAIDWNIYISNEQFFQKLSVIEKELARREGLKRGWLTYTELSQMLPSFTLAKFLLNNITVMAVSYAASVMTIAGAFFLASQIPGHLLHRKVITTSTAAAAANTTTTTATISPLGKANNATQTATATTTTTTTTTVTIVDTSDALILMNRTKNATKIGESERIENEMNAAAGGGGGGGLNCCAAAGLNVELELLKLERQYRKEALQDALRKRYNELTSLDLHFNFYDTLAGVKLGLHKNPSLHEREMINVERNWLTFKNDYSDEIEQRDLIFSGTATATNSLTTSPAATATTTTTTTTTNSMGIKLTEANVQTFTHFDDYWTTINNCTRNFFLWQLFTNAAQQSYVRLPLMWFKFI